MGDLQFARSLAWTPKIKENTLVLKKSDSKEYVTLQQYIEPRIYARCGLEFFYVVHKYGIDYWDGTTLEKNKITENQNMHFDEDHISFYFTCVGALVIKYEYFSNIVYKDKVRTLLPNSMFSRRIRYIGIVGNEPVGFIEEYYPDIILYTDLGTGENLFIKRINIDQTRIFTDSSGNMYFVTLSRIFCLIQDECFFYEVDLPDIFTGHCCMVKDIGIRLVCNFHEIYFFKFSTRKFELDGNLMDYFNKTYMNNPLRHDRYCLSEEMPGKKIKWNYPFYKSIYAFEVCENNISMTTMFSLFDDPRTFGDIPIASTFLYTVLFVALRCNLKHLIQNPGREFRILLSLPHELQLAVLESITGINLHLWTPAHSMAQQFINRCITDSF